MGIGASSSSGGAHAPPMRIAYAVNRDARLRWGGLPAPACDLSSVRRDACHLMGSLMSELAIADCAKSIAAIRVQLVKYILHLLNGTVRSACGAQLPGRSMSGGVTHAGSHSGLRPTIIGCRRDRRRFGAGQPPCLRSPGRSPERNRGHRCENDNGQRNVRRHPVLHGARLLSYVLRSPADLLCCLGRFALALTTLWNVVAGGVRLTDEPSLAPYVLWPTPSPDQPPDNQ